MSVSPPVIERTISCRYPSIEADRFVDTHKRWQGEIGLHGFEQKLVKHWDIDIPEDPQTRGPDLSNAAMMLTESYHYKKGGNIILRPCQDFFSVNLLGAENTSFEQAKQLAEQFVPMWLALAEIKHPFAIEVVYINQFTNAHFAPFINSDGGLQLGKVFQLPDFCPINGGNFISPLQQSFTWASEDDLGVLLAVHLKVSPVLDNNRFFARLTTTGTQLLINQDVFSTELFQKSLTKLHKLHAHAFQKILTKKMLQHCGIEPLSTDQRRMA